MQITLTNVGAIKETSSINLSGLSVIAGPNGTGKSTVGKTVYSIVKAIGCRQEIVLEYLSSTINQFCANIYFTIINNINGNEDGVIARKFGANPFFVTINNFLRSNSNDANQANHDFIVSHIDMIDSIKTLNTSNKELAKKGIESILNLLRENSFEASIRHTLFVMHSDVFMGQFGNIYNNGKSFVSFDTNGNENFSYCIDNADETKSEKSIEVAGLQSGGIKSIYNDATFIETPLILSLSTLRMIQPPLVHYYKDLLDKLSKQLVPEVSQPYKKIHSAITEVIGGELEHNKNTREFFLKKNDTDIKLVLPNMATGAKEFGMIQRMIRCGLFSPDKIVIFDEPENHLHPVWQVRLAEVLITLVKNGVNILMTSHSPQLIDALQTLTVKNSLTDKVNFYFANDGFIKNITEMQDADGDPIFNSFYSATKAVQEFEEKK